MRVCVVTDWPSHPLLVGLADLLTTRYRVDVVDVTAMPAARGETPGTPSPADVYLLKSHSPAALAIAREAEEHGARVLNRAAPTELCQDRARMAERAWATGLPFPRTHEFARLSGLLAYVAGSGVPRFPLVVKSRRTGRENLVRQVGCPAELSALCDRWAQEPVVVQKYVRNDDWDLKVWVVGDRVFAGLRRSPLQATATRATLPLDAADLPSGLLDVVRDVGRAFDLEVYGADILCTRHGPLVVDVNAFPGCRGTRGAPEALATLVERAHPAAHRGMPSIAGPARRTSSRNRSSLTQGGTSPGGRGPGPAALLHAAVSALATALAPSLGRPGTDVLKVSYLRRKPGQGLVACYRAVPAPRGAPPVVSVRVREGRETAEDGAGTRARPPLPYPWTGLSLDAFPADPGLPGLPAALAPAREAAALLHAACRTLTGDPGAWAAEVRTVVVAYKPGARCVLHYRVRVASGASFSDIDLFGKVYRTEAEAVAAHRAAETIWPAGEDRTGPALVPRPLGVLGELGLVLSEAAGGGRVRDRIEGHRVLRPAGPPSRGGVPLGGVGSGEDALAGTAATLAALHSCAPGGSLTETRTGALYAARARDWSAALARQSPGHAAPLSAAAEALAAALPRTRPLRPVPVHGAFKPNQLVFCGWDRPVVTDLDSMSLGDPAADVGYFLAYLRPRRFWTGHARAREWFAEARDAFCEAYRREAGRRGGGSGDATLTRAALFEAATLLKLASRRVRHVDAARPREIAGVLAEIELCLRRFARRQILP